MEITPNTFYKTVTEGHVEPGGYFYVTAVAADNVSFIVTEGKQLPDRAGVFTLPIDQFKVFIDQEATPCR